mmetsp:Transcript_161015/g.294069  ORF Transcript_161015/g.294069 Transcript_161015/m.294069 type:complete len:290 (+) Transcript_161015:41-910(+)
MERSDLRPEVSAYEPGEQLEGGGSEIVRGEDGLGSLFLGPYNCCLQPFLSNLQERGVGGIVNCTLNYPCVHEGILDYSCVPVDDLPSEDILPYLEGAARFIDRHVQAGRSVLVHCEMGRSRSSTVVIAYLMRFHGLSRDDAYIYAKTRRFSVNPNQGFWEQLKRFESQAQHVSDGGPTISFGGDWAAKSCATFGTCGDTLVGEGPYSPEEVEGALEACLNYMFSRGVDVAAIKWFAALCDSFSPTVATPIAQQMLNRDSPFMESWGSEVSTKVLERLLDSLPVLSTREA